MPKPTKAKPATRRAKPTKAKRPQKATKRPITRDQFHSLVRKAAQPVKKPKSK